MVENSNSKDIFIIVRQQIKDDSTQFYNFFERVSLFGGELYRFSVIIKDGGEIVKCLCLSQ